MHDRRFRREPERLAGDALRGIRARHVRPDRRKHDRGRAADHRRRRHRYRKARPLERQPESRLRTGAAATSSRRPSPAGTPRRTRRRGSSSRTPRCDDRRAGAGQPNVSRGTARTGSRSRPAPGSRSSRTRSSPTWASGSACRTAPTTARARRAVGGGAGGHRDPRHRLVARHAEPQLPDRAVRQPGVRSERLHRGPDLHRLRQRCDRRVRGRVVRRVRARPSGANDAVGATATDRRPPATPRSSRRA